MLGGKLRGGNAHYPSTQVICEGTGLPAPELWWTLGTEAERQPGGTQLRLNKLTKDVVAVCHGQSFKMW
jgi:hypothetical protein